MQKEIGPANPAHDIFCVEMYSWIHTDTFRTRNYLGTLATHLQGKHVDKFKDFVQEHNQKLQGGVVAA